MYGNSHVNSSYKCISCLRDSPKRKDMHYVINCAEPLFQFHPILQKVQVESLLRKQSISLK